MSGHKLPSMRVVTMSLPLFDKKRMASTIMERRSKDGSKGASAEVNTEDSDYDHELRGHAVALLQAIERKSPDEIARAFKDMWTCLETNDEDEDGDVKDADDEYQE